MDSFRNKLCNFLSVCEDNSTIIEHSSSDEGERNDDNLIKRKLNIRNSSSSDSDQENRCQLPNIIESFTTPAKVYPKKSHNNSLRDHRSETKFNRRQKRKFRLNHETPLRSFPGVSHKFGVSSSSPEIQKRKSQEVPGMVAKTAADFLRNTSIYEMDSLRVGRAAIRSMSNTHLISSFPSESQRVRRDDISTVSSTAQISSFLSEIQPMAQDDILPLIGNFQSESQHAGPDEIPTVSNAPQISSFASESQRVNRDKIPTVSSKPLISNFLSKIQRWGRNDILPLIGHFPSERQHVSRDEVPTVSSTPLISSFSSEIQRVDRDDIPLLIGNFPSESQRAGPDDILTVGRTPQISVFPSDDESSSTDSATGSPTELDRFLALVERQNRPPANIPPIGPPVKIKRCRKGGYLAQFMKAQQTVEIESKFLKHDKASGIRGGTSLCVQRIDVSFGVHKCTCEVIDETEEIPEKAGIAPNRLRNGIYSFIVNSRLASRIEIGTELMAFIGPEVQTYKCTTFDGLTDEIYVQPSKVILAEQLTGLC